MVHHFMSDCFSGEPILNGAAKFASLAFPLVSSFMVIAVATKHRMASVGGFVSIETGFLLVHYAIVRPLIAAVYRRKADGALV